MVYIIQWAPGTGNIPGRVLQGRLNDWRESVAADKSKTFDFGALVAAIEQVDRHLTAQAGRGR